MLNPVDSTFAAKYAIGKMQWNSQRTLKFDQNLKIVKKFEKIENNFTIFEENELLNEE